MVFPVITVAVTVTAALSDTNVIVVSIILSHVSNMLLLAVNRYCGYSWSNFEVCFVLWIWGQKFQSLLTSLSCMVISRAVNGYLFFASL